MAAPYPSADPPPPNGLRLLRSLTVRSSPADIDLSYTGDDTDVLIIVSGGDVWVGAEPGIEAEVVGDPTFIDGQAPTINRTSDLTLSAVTDGPTATLYLYVGDAKFPGGIDLPGANINGVELLDAVTVNASETLTVDGASVATTAALDAKADLVAGQVPVSQLASGTPDGTKFVRDDGTLAAVERGVELDYAEITTSPAAYVLGINGTTDILDLVVEVPATDRPVMLTLYLPAVSHSVASARLRARILEGASGTDYIAHVEKTMPTTAGRVDEFVVKRRIPPSDVARTFRAGLAVGGEAGNVTVFASDPNPVDADFVPFLEAVAR